MHQLFKLVPELRPGCLSLGRGCIGVLVTPNEVNGSASKLDLNVHEASWVNNSPFQSVCRAKMLGKDAEDSLPCMCRVSGVHEMKIAITPRAFKFPSGFSDDGSFYALMFHPDFQLI